MLSVVLLVEIIAIVRIVESPIKRKCYKENEIFSFPYVYEFANATKFIFSENKLPNFRNSKKSKWDHEAYWIYANTYTDLFMPLILSNLKEIGIDPIDVHNITDVIWMKALFLNCTARINLTNGRIKYISELERQGDAFISFSTNNFIQLNVTVINSYLLCIFNYDFLTTMFPFFWHSGNLLANVTNVLSNLLLTLDLTKQFVDLEKFTILDIESVHVTLNNSLPIFDEFASKIVNYFLPFYKEKIIQVSEKTVSQEIFMRMKNINEIFFYS